MAREKPFVLSPISDEWLSEFSRKVAAYREGRAPRDRSAGAIPPPPSSGPGSADEKYRAVVAIAKEHALKMDRTDTDFFSAATKQLVSTVLQREFGNSIAQYQQFPKMQNAITSVIMKNQKYRQALEGLFDILGKTDEPPPGGNASPPPGSL